MEQIRVLLADDHPTVSAGTRRILEGHSDVDVVGQASDGEQALKLAESLRPDVLVLDIRMPGMDGIEVIRRLERFSPDTRALVFTAYDDDAYILAWMEAGGAGYLLKTCQAEQLLEAVRQVHQGKTVLDPGVITKIGHLWADQRRKLVNPITGRELEVLSLAAYGLRNRAIAQRLNISVRTVEGHFNSIYSKLKVNSRVEAIIYALSQNIISLKEEDGEGGGDSKD